MMKNFLAGAVVATTLAFAGSASALTYVSAIEHNDNNLTVDGDYGEVIIEELDANTLKLTVNLFAPQELIVDTGAHFAFTFNLLADTGTTTVDILNPVDDGTFEYLGAGAYDSAPFKDFTHAFSCCGQGAANGETPPLVFTITNTAGITFAGLGATYDLDGRLLTTGTGNRLTSTPNTYNNQGGLKNLGGWWFSVDTVDENGATGAKAARDAFVVTTVPEPSTWGLMILGFGGAGAMIRRRRTVFA